MKEIVGLDIDMPLGEGKVDILQKIKFLSGYMEYVTEMNAEVIGEIETRPCFRIRLKGIMERP